MTTNPLDFALRVVESIAFSLHGVLGVTEPFTGCLRSAFGDGGAMPSWFWPAAGVMLFVIASANFSRNDSVVLAAQAYVASFHIGAGFYHVRLGHHPVVGLVPGVFAVFAFFIVVMRTNFLVASLGLLACAAVAAVLCWILVTPPPSRGEQQDTTSSSYLLAG